MRRLLLALASLLVAGAALAGDHYRHSYSNIGDADECDGRHFRFSDRRAYVAEETIEAGNLASLKVSTENAPVKVVGGNRGGYTILVCKAAEFAEDLDKIHVSVSGGELRADGPSSNHDWIVAYRILAPDRANLDVETRNGPICFRDLKGTVNASVTNGPVSLENVDGEVDVTAKNGPISVDGVSGNIKVRASNGPLSVRLDGNSFNGTLDASTRNGPLSVKVPRGYNTGVIVETNGRGPISCHAEGCGRARSDSWDDDDTPRRIELGNGPENVHISTVNGPVTIREN